MGSILDKLHAGKSNQSELLTKTEKQIVREIWQQITNNYPNFMLKVWTSVVKKNTTVAEIFGVSEHADEKEVGENEKIRAICAAVNKFFEHVIVGLDLDGEKIGYSSWEMGARHVNYTKKGFMAVYWDLFSVCMVEEIERMGMCDDEEEWLGPYTWQKFVHLVLNQMLAGYKDQRKINACKIERNITQK